MTVVVPGSVRDAVLSLDQIPPLSTTADELLRVAADPDLDSRRLAAILDKDAALAARIIGLANSAFFGHNRPVLAMQDAIVRVLGQEMVRSLALSMALAGCLDMSRCPNYDLRHYWVVALGTGMLARDLAVAVGRSDVIHPDAAYLCGLLHSLGELGLLHLRPDLMCEVADAIAKDPSLDPAELERVHLGVDRWQAGEWLAFRWHLPEQVQHTMNYFYAGSYEGPHQSLVQVVAAARAWVLASLAGELPDMAPPDAAAAEFQRIVQAFHGNLDELRQAASQLL